MCLYDKDGKPEAIHGVIYTPNYEVGKQKLLEIKKEKEKLGIKCERYSINNFAESYVRFENRDVWRVINSSNHNIIRGIKWDIIYIDVYNVTVRQKEEAMYYSGMYRFEPRSFNYNNEYAKKDGEE